MLSPLCSYIPTKKRETERKIDGKPRVAGGRRTDHASAELILVFVKKLRDIVMNESVCFFITPCCEMAPYEYIFGFQYALLKDYIS